MVESDTATSNSNVIGGYVTAVIIPDSKITTGTYAIIPMGCNEKTDGNRAGIIRPQTPSYTCKTFFICGNHATVFQAYFMLLYR